MFCVSSGIPGLDAVLNGGIPQGNVVIVEGAPGTGKSTMGMQFLYEGAAYREQSGMYISFEQLPEQLYADMMTFGWDLKRLEKQDRLRVVCIAPEILLEHMMEPNGWFEQTVRQIDCRRIVIDSISLYRYCEADSANRRLVLNRIRNILRKLSMTSLLILESPETESNVIPPEHYVFDGVIRLSFRSFDRKYRERTMEVLKMRSRDTATGEHVYRITDQGIRLLPEAAPL